MRFQHLFFPRFAAACVGVGIAGACNAAIFPVAMTNDSFESPELPNGGASTGVNSWIVTGNCGTLDPSTDHLPFGQALDGQNVAYVTGGSSIQQNTAVLHAFTTYTLQVGVAHRLDRPFASATVEAHAEGGDLLASGVVKVLSPGAWTTVTLTWDAPISTPAQARSLRVVLRAGVGGDALFDRVRLTADHAPATLHVPSPQFPTINVATHVIWPHGGDTILVAPGVYPQPLNIYNSVFTLRSAQGPAQTILDGSGVNRILLARNSGNAEPLRIEGFTFRNGYAWPTGGADLQGSMEFSNCRFENNRGSYGGAAIYLVGAANPSFVLTDCEFEGNQAEAAGAVVANADAIVVSRCRFSDNQSSGVNPGAVELNAEASLRLDRCEFIANRSAGAQGALRAFAPQHRVTNSLFHANESGDGGAAYFYTQDFGFPSNSLFANCTFEGNVAPPGRLAGLGVSAASAATVANIILWSNRSGGDANQSAQIQWVYSPTFSHLNVSGLSALPGIGHISAPPVFVSAVGPDQIAGTGDEDFRLLRPSPCIDAADTPAIAAIGLAVDLGGNPRARTDPRAAQTGEPELGATWADIGAYEFQPPTCAGDLNSDGRVDFLDLNTLLSYYAEPCAPR